MIIVKLRAVRKDPKNLVFVPHQNGILAGSERLEHDITIPSDFDGMTIELLIVDQRLSGIHDLHEVEFGALLPQEKFRAQEAAECGTR